MTVSSTTNLVSYAGDDATDVFAYPFKVFAETELLVVLKDDTTGVETELTLTTHYSVSGVGEDGGGNVTMVTAPATGETLVIKRVLPLTQATDYVVNDAFPAETHEADLDRLIMIAQQLQEIIDRCFKGQVSTDWSGISLTVPDPEAGKALGWNTDGTQLVNLSEMSGVNVSAWAEIFLASLTSAAALTNLDVTAYAQTILAAANASAARTLLDVYSKSDVYSQAEVNARFPAGSLLFYTGTLPTGFLECDGSAVNRTTYASLFSAIGVVYGSGDGSTTFNLPDYRGRFFRSWAHGQSTDPDRASRTDRGDGTGGDNVGTKQADEFKAHTHGVYYAVEGDAATAKGIVGVAGSTTPTTSSGGNETRPININVLVCIKY